MNKRLLVVGGAGYVGTRFCQQFSNKYDITVLDPLWFGNFLPLNVKVIKDKSINITSSEFLVEFDTVLFLGGVSNDPMAEFSPSKNFIENLASPVHLAFLISQAAKKHGQKRFIYASSCSVYGYATDPTVGKKEENTTSISEPYGISKFFSDEAINHMTSDTFRPICLRKGTIGGFSERLRFDLLVNTMVKTGIQHKKINVYDPSVYRPVIDIRDIVAIYDNMIESELDITGIFNICHENVMIIDVAKKVQDVLLKFGYDTKIQDLNKPDVRSYSADCTKFKDTFEFRTRYSIADTASHLIEKIKKNIETEGTNFFNRPSFSNIEMFRSLDI